MSCSSVQRGTRFVTGAQLNGKVAHRLRHLGKIFHMFPPSGHQEGQKTAFRGWTDRKGKRGSPGHREVVLGAASHSHSRVHTALPGVPGRTELRKGPSSLASCPPAAQQEDYAGQCLALLLMRRPFLFPGLVRENEGYRPAGVHATDWKGQKPTQTLLQGLLCGYKTRSLWSRKPSPQRPPGNHQRQLGTRCSPFLLAPLPELQLPRLLPGAPLL